MFTNIVRISTDFIFAQMLYFELSVFIKGTSSLRATSRKQRLALQIESFLVAGGIVSIIPTLKFSNINFRTKKMHKVVLKNGGSSWKMGSIVEQTFQFYKFWKDILSPIAIFFRFKLFTIPKVTDVLKIPTRNIAKKIYNLSWIKKKEKKNG